MYAMNRVYNQQSGMVDN
uniref:Uncharacterized protein n=1 Tax=Anguilla anguilla TaxID=7936 RepID=A0A0E9RLQ9_ANGAN